MSDKRLRVFYSVALNQSFTQASKDLNMTQPAATFHIKQLEKTYGVKLFDRQSNKSTLTEVGEVMFNYTKQLFDLYAKMDGEIAELAGQKKDRLCIAATAKMSDYFLPNIIAKFKQLTPTATVKLITASDEEIAKLLSLGKADIGICEKDLNDSKYDSVTIDEEEIVAVFSSSHPQANSDKISLQELSKLPLILEDKGNFTRDYFEEHIGNLNIALELSSVEAIKSSVENNVGVAVLPKSSVVKEEKQGVLSIVSLAPSLKKKLMIFFLTQSYENKMIAEFLEFCVSVLEKDESNERIVI